MLCKVNVSQLVFSLHLMEPYALFFLIDPYVIFFMMGQRIPIYPPVLNPKRCIESSYEYWDFDPSHCSWT